MGSRRSVDIVGNQSYPAKKGGINSKIKDELLYLTRENMDLRAEVRNMEAENADLTKEVNILTNELNHIHYAWAAVTLTIVILMGIIYAIFG